MKLYFKYVVIFVMLSLPACKASTPESRFWNWFEGNQDSLFVFEDNRESVLDDISEKLEIYKPGLVFEISTVENRKREFVISADGIKELFPYVKKLAISAPKLEKWKVVAFRPRIPNYTRFALNYEGRKFEPKLIWTFHRIENGKFDLVVYHPEYSESQRDTFVEGTFLLLDMALGEYDVTTGIRHIDSQRLPKNPKEQGLSPLRNLRATFDEYKKNRKR